MRVEIDPYVTLRESLQEAGLQVRRPRTDLLTFSSANDAGGPAWRKSFWLSRVAGRWYLSTWMPFYYRVPDGQDLLELSLACVTSGATPAGRMPSALVRRFNLQEIDELQHERLDPPVGPKD